ncbi:hypothetical protein SEPCBS57363_004266 [Sporothrix epigloea]|uniref:Uncharacterized protein n=1 Tax=Sporothrix epigloea TaxID=1892477 RepID=A0ABP0DRB5_9PEZI
MLKSESVDIVPADMALSSIPLISSGNAINEDAMPNPANGHDGLPTQFGLPLSQQVYNSFSQQQGHANGAPSWYRYSPEYGTITAPLQWSQWRAGLSVTSGSIAHASGSDLQQHLHQHSSQRNQQTYENGTIQPPFVAQQHIGAMLDGSCGDDTTQHDSHMCSCGDGCECVGCLVHPYNDATRNTVQSMWSLMDDASSTASSARTATATTSSRTPLMSQQQQGPGSTEQGFTPSDTSGASDDEVILPAGDFLFVSYPIMGCDGEEMTCPLDANADYGTFGPLFAYYLRENGGHILLTEAEQKAQIGGGKDNNYAREVQRRWRRFVKRWNRHELSDRWYEPLLYLRVVRAQQNASAVERPVTESVSETGRDDDSKGQENSDENGESDDDNDDDGYGPVLPPNQTLPNKASLAASSSSRSRHLGAPGPSIPSRADLDERRALDDDMQDAERATLRLTRRADRAEQRERLDELAPRAAAGTRERHLEKKRELNEKLRGFRDRSPGGGGLEMDDDELMGGDRGSGRKSAKDLQKDAEAAQARRTYWQQRREEEQRARNEELNERRAQYREREAETMDMLRELARQRFG